MQKHANMVCSVHTLRPVVFHFMHLSEHIPLSVSTARQFANETGVGLGKKNTIYPFLTEGYLLNFEVFDQIFNIFIKAEYI